MGRENLQEWTRIEAMNLQVASWSAPARRSGDGALSSVRQRALPDSTRVGESDAKAVSRFACHRTPRSCGQGDGSWKARKKIAQIGFAVLIGCISFGVGQVRGQDQQTSTSLEYKVKAAYLFNFAKYVEWPSSTFSGPEAPITIGVLGDDPFGAILEKTVARRIIGGRSVVIQRSKRLEAIKTCQVIFISTSEKVRLPEILAELAKTHALTVSEMERFLEQGGMVSFVFEKGGVQFEINSDKAREAGLGISARMLGSAKAVHSKKRM
jgi:hypothetical protein